MFFFSGLEGDFKMSKKITRAGLSLLVAVSATFGMAAAASAGDHKSTTTGAESISVSTTISSKDTAGDGNWTRANWNSASGEGGINNKSGSGTTASGNTGKDITAVQACRSNPGLTGMSCGTWNNKS